MEKLPCYSVSLIFFPISHPHRLALPSSGLSHRRSARACVCECIGKAKRNIFSALHSCLQAGNSPTPGARREKSFRPLWWCARVENVGRAIADKAGKFVSANLEVGATRSVSLLRIAHPQLRASFPFLSSFASLFSAAAWRKTKRNDRESEQVNRRSKKIPFCTHFNK